MHIKEKISKIQKLTSFEDNLCDDENSKNTFLIQIFK